MERSPQTGTDASGRPTQVGHPATALEKFRAQWRLLDFYQRFEHLVTLVLTMLIAVIVVAALWNLIFRTIEFVLNGLNPTDNSVFQSTFGMIFTVLIALEFKKTLLIVTERHAGIVHVRAVLVIAMLAIVRKLMILDLTTTSTRQLFALSCAILALGAVYWLTRDQDRREREAEAEQ
jgi:uncharacterized membrane protein (DUF373 family)